METKSNLVAKFIYNIILKQTYVIEQNTDFHPNFQIKQKDFEDTSKKSPVAWACLRGKGPLPLGFCSANRHKMLHCNLTKPSWGLGNTKPWHFYSCAGILERWSSKRELWTPRDLSESLSGVFKIRSVFTIILRCYPPFSLCWHLYWWCKSSGG